MPSRDKPCKDLLDKFHESCKLLSMSLPEYIKKHGDEKCAEMFRTKVRTVGSWRRRERYPRREKAREMIAVANGELTMSDIFGDSKAA